ncbi:MAG: hypothetical protein PWP44_248 [Thermacetogenium sp.]|nr:hypothetical protein [Thermacetogenium sp.]
MMGVIEFPIRTTKRVEMVEITSTINNICKERGVDEGLCCIFVPHTTCGIMVNEHADPSVVHDIAGTLEKLIPFEADYRHTEGNSAAHIKAALTGVSLTIPVSGGRLLLGTWQGVFLCEFDGPRQRRVCLKICKC